MNKKRIGRHIKEARKNANLTQAQLAEIAHISKIHVSHIETGKANMSVDTLVDICEILDVTPNDILAGEYLNASIESMVFYERSNRLNYDDKLLLQFIFRYMKERNGY